MAPDTDSHASPANARCVEAATDAAPGTAGNANAPTVGILYESDEWSDHKLARELRNALADEGCDAGVALVNMEAPDAIERALACSLLVSRVFASARFRDHDASLARMAHLVEAAQTAGIPMLNRGSAHRFEVDKQAATEALCAAGLDVPAVFACAEAHAIQGAALPYPCIIKPNCGGRTAHTAILRDAAEAERFLRNAPEGAFIVEEYIEPELGFLTRIEIVGGRAALTVKRSVAASGLSGYHEGSTYAPYADCSAALVADAELAARTLGFDFGSFDVVECARGRFFIDANSVPNVPEDCAELLGCDLMALHACAMAKRFAEAQACRRATHEGDPQQPGPSERFASR